jgi:hypothetical protein
MSFPHLDRAWEIRTIGRHELSHGCSLVESIQTTLFGVRRFSCGRNAFVANDRRRLLKQLRSHFHSAFRLLRLVSESVSCGLVVPLRQSLLNRREETVGAKDRVCVRVYSSDVLDF